MDLFRPVEACRVLGVERTPAGELKAYMPGWDPTELDYAGPVRLIDPSLHARVSTLRSTPGGRSAVTEGP